MSKWEKTNLWLKQHYLCVIVWLVVVLIALIVVMAGNDKELVGYFSFACSLSGILLAIVVIIHTWIDSADTRTVLTEVKSHLTDIRGDVGKTEGAVTKLKIDILQQINKIRPILKLETQTSPSKPDKKKTINITKTKDALISNLEEMVSNLEEQVFITEQQFLIASTLAAFFITKIDDADVVETEETEESVKGIYNMAYKRVESKCPDEELLSWAESFLSGEF